jgi:hypothetical protein
MSVTGIPPSPTRIAFRHAVRCALLAIPLWLGLVHLPAPASIEIFDARPMALDYAVRNGIGLGTALPSDVGPLGALLTTTHSGQPLWVNFWCQVLVGAAFAVGLALSIWRMNSPARWWVLGGLLVVAGFRPEYMHTTSMLLFGLMLLSQPLGRVEAIGSGLMLGLLGLINVQFALLGGLVIAAARANPAPGTARNVAVFAGGSLLLTFLIGWFWAGQPGGDLLPWLGHGLLPASLRYQAAAWSGPALMWGLLALAALGAAIVGTVAASPARRRELVPAAFVLLVLFLAWRRATGQPDAQPQLFFTAVFMAALVWIALKLSSAPRRWLPAVASVAAFAAAAGLLVVEPRILTESIILLNQKMVANAAAVADRPAWQRGLNDSFRSSAALFALPRIKAATEGKRTDLLGNATAYALVNRFNYAPRPGLQSYRVGDPRRASRDATYYSGASAPDFVAQRLQAFDRGLPALEDALAQLALYAHYDFQFEENGFALWKRRAAGPGTTPALGEPVWKTEAAWDKPITLPLQPGRGYWLSIKASRSTMGWLKGHLFSPSDPILMLQDAEGGALSYRAAPENLAIGFLLFPLFRGEIDLVRYQAGEAPAVIREITLQKPAGAAGDFSGELEIALHEVPLPAVSGHRASAEAFAQRYRIGDRLPVAVTAYYPPQTTQLDGRDVLLAHPDSSIEFPVRAGDTSLHGRFGLLDGAYQNGNATDGVDFAVEYVPARGAPVMLWQRYLDPVNQTGDRGVQSFTVALPQPASGRVILRTQNLPGRNAAWDWSLWTDLRFNAPPATK